jgi:hypothetical protein
MRLGGSGNALEDFPDKPKGIHWRSYNRLRRIYDTAKARSMRGLNRFVDGEQQ